MISSIIRKGKNNHLTFHLPKNNYCVCYDKKWHFLVFHEIQFLNNPFEIKEFDCQSSFGTQIANRNVSISR